jgi:hypothetical protein
MTHGAGSVKQFTAVFDLKSCFCVQRTRFRIEQNPNTAQNKSLLKLGAAVKQQSGSNLQAGFKGFASSDCCRRWSHKRFTSSDRILAGKSTCMLIVPGISFYRRARRSWSNKLRRFFISWNWQLWIHDASCWLCTIWWARWICGCLLACTCLLCYMRFFGSSVW